MSISCSAKAVDVMGKVADVMRKIADVMRKIVDVMRKIVDVMRKIADCGFLSKVYFSKMLLSKVYEMYPTCVSSKLCEFIYF